MTIPPHLSPRTRANRPAGYFPRGTSLGLVGLIGLLVGIPFFGLECAAPFVAHGFDRWLATAPIAAGVGIVGGLAIAFSMATHRYWSVCLFFYAGRIMLVAYAGTLAFALATLSGLFPVQERGLGAMPIVGLILLLCLGLGAVALLRALRLRYWQPGTTPDMWETGNEAPRRLGTLVPDASPHRRASLPAKIRRAIPVRAAS